MINYWKNLKIKTKILISILSASGVAMLSLCLVSFIGTNNMARFSKNAAKNFGNFSAKSSEESLKNQAEEYIKKISENIANMGDSLLDEVKDQVIALCIGTEEIYRSNLATQPLPPLPENTVKGTLENRESASEKAFLFEETQTAKEELKILSNARCIAKPLYVSNIAVANVYIGTKNGVFYSFTRNNNAGRFDPRTRNWYKDALKDTSKPIWQSTYIDALDGSFCITCSKAFLSKSGEVLGVVGIDMYLEDINKYVIETKIGNTGFSFVLNKSGEIIMHPDYKSDMSNFKNNPLSNKSIDESYRNLLEKMESGEKGVQTANIAGGNFYVGFAPMETTQWSLAVATEIEEIVAPTVALKNNIEKMSNETNDLISSDLIKILLLSLAIFAIFAVLIYILSTKITKNLTKPIETLKDGAQKIGAGDLSLKINIDSNDEIGSLGKSFEKMAENLKIYMGNLKITTIEKQKIQSELEIARKIQKSMLPYTFPAFPDRKEFDIYAMMDPARLVGGDFYDFFFVNESHIAILVADVSGKGISAALFMVIAKILLKNEIQAGFHPAQVLENINNKLCENNEADMFVTAFLGIVNIHTGELEFSNAGHNPPFILKNSQGKYIKIHENRGFVLGAKKNIKYKNENLKLEKSDVLFMYTDGVTEAMNKKLELFSEDRLEKIFINEKFKKISLENLIKEIRNQIKIFGEGTERADDITMLGFEQK